MKSSGGRSEGTVENDEIALGPYRDLHIYLIEGVVTEEDEAAFGNGFLGTWLEGQSSFLFFSGPSERKVTKFVEERRDLEFVEKHHFTYEQWQGSAPQPIRVENFLILPPWERVEPQGGELRIILDPGVVFGTGLHPTTRDCLRALAYIRNQAPIGKVVDFGTGSGILAIAGGLLGAEQVLAIDLNPLAVKTAQRNVELNHLERVIRVVKGNVEEFVEERADLMIANIHYGVMGKLIHMDGFREKDWFILSGLMRSNLREIKDKIEKYHLQLIREWDHEATWYTLLVRNDIL
jgi:ribosomal protein L11 methyltransferase